jgi:hypothetical protein
VIVVVATMLIASHYWSGITPNGRILIVGGAGMALLAGGLAVPARLADVGVRLRSILWLASTAATGGFLGLLGSEVLGLTDADLALMIAFGTAVLGAVLVEPAPRHCPADRPDGRPDGDGGGCHC